MVSTGFSFDDGEQVLVSLQKPLGIILEQDDDNPTNNNDGNDSNTAAPVVVADLDPTGNAAQAGIQVGDVLVAIQNASVQDQSLEYILAFLGQAPRVVNLRFIRSGS